MITGFLIRLKLINSRSKSINWLRLYVSRLFRILPLYFTFLAVLFIIVAILSDFTLKEPIHVLIAHSMKYLPGGLLGTPDLNSINQTALIFCDVTWILKWEWFFYASLPIIAIVVKNKPPLFYIAMSIIFIVSGYIFVDFRILPYLRYFGGGMLAAFLAGCNGFRSRISGNVGAIIVLLCVTLIISFCERLPRISHGVC